MGEVGAVWQHLAQCFDAPIANVVACGTVKGLDWKTLGFGFTMWYYDAWCHTMACTSMRFGPCLVNRAHQFEARKVCVRGYCGSNSYSDVIVAVCHEVNSC